MDARSWFTAGGSLVCGWAALLVVERLISGRIVRRRRAGTWLRVYLACSAVGGTVGVGHDVWMALTQGIALGTLGEEVLVFTGFALLWPYIVLFGIAVWLWGGHG